MLNSIKTSNLLILEGTKDNYFLLIIRFVLSHIQEKGGKKKRPSNLEGRLYSIKLKTS
jgi:hypothetical protein